jgi:hypothetical protein
LSKYVKEESMMAGWMDKQTNQPTKQTNKQSCALEGGKEPMMHGLGEEEWVGMWVPTHHITGFNFT